MTEQHPVSPVAEHTARMVGLDFLIPPDLLLSANKMPRNHGHRNRIVQTLRALGFWKTKQAKPKPMGRAELQVRIAWPNRRRRDDANVHPTLKAIVDGVVDAGLLPDDDNTRLRGPYPYTVPELCEPRYACRLWFDFTELEEAN